MSKANRTKQEFTRAKDSLEKLSGTLAQREGKLKELTAEEANAKATFDHLMVHSPLSFDLVARAESAWEKARAAQRSMKIKADATRRERAAKKREVRALANELPYFPQAALAAILGAPHDDNTDEDGGPDKPEPDEDYKPDEDTESSSDEDDEDDEADGSGILNINSVPEAAVLTPPKKGKGGLSRSKSPAPAVPIKTSRVSKEKEVSKALATLRKLAPELIVPQLADQPVQPGPIENLESPRTKELREHEAFLTALPQTAGAQPPQSPPTATAGKSQSSPGLSAPLNAMSFGATPVQPMSNGDDPASASFQAPAGSN
jgi:hypothetical protein